MKERKVAEKYFNQVLFVAQTLKRFIDEVQNLVDNDTLRSLESYDILLPYKQTKNPLITATLIDIANGYFFMGHSLDTNTTEGLGLILANYSLLEPECEFVDYASWADNKALKHSAVDTFSFIEKMDECKYWLEKRDFLLADTLKSINPEMAERYVLRLYRFFETIAAVDGIVTKEEEETIKNILPDISKYIID